MGYDGGGVYSRQRNFSADASAGIRILASAMDQEIDDVASAFNVALPRDGRAAATGNIPMGGNRLVNVGAPTAANEYMRARDFIENVPIFMLDTTTSTDTISVSASFFTSVSAAQAPRDGTKAIVRMASNKASAPVMRFSGHSANVHFTGGAAVDGFVSGAVYELMYASAEGVWETYSDRLIPRTAAEIAAGVTPTNYQYPELFVDRYATNAIPGTTDMTQAIQAACDVAKTRGGGIVEFQSATYLLSTEGSHSVVVPVAGSNFSDNTQDMTYNILLDNASNVEFRGRGATLLSDVTSGNSAILLMDGPRHFRTRGVKFQAQHTHDASGNPVVHSAAAIAITSQDRNSYNIDLDDVEIEDCYTGIYVFGTDTRTYSVRGLSANRARHTNGIYTLAFHMNGDGVVAKDVVSSDVSREYFIYGVSDHDVSTLRDTQLDGFQWVIKTYHVRDTKNIRYKPRVTSSSSSSNGALQVQHATAVQATPNRLINIELDIDNAGTTTTALSFSYFAGAGGSVDTATSSNNLFTGIVLKGILDQAPTMSVTQIGAAGAYGTLNADGVTLLNGSLQGLFVESGFLDNKMVRTTFNPSLKINSVTTGITYSARAGEYWRDGHFIDVLMDLTLSSKGAQTGAVTIDLPLTSSAINSNSALISVIGASNCAGLTGPIVGYVQTAGDLLILQLQGATGTANLTDAELTNTSRLQVHCRYPIS